MSAVKVKPAKAVASHPKYIDMIVNAVKALADKSGSSRQAINKYIVKEYSLTENNHHNAMLKQALKRGSDASGPLVHNKGKGAAGSFKIKPAPTKPAKPAAKKAPAKKPRRRKPLPRKRPPRRRLQPSPRNQPRLLLSCQRKNQPWHQQQLQRLKSPPKLPSPR
ncbi:Histone H1.0 [Desmophyllum pertusum]|uniref:Histone H1.0 n=1 Tax=Desmophyllum pertusum TaxID=174260 RepID=A0A9W9Z029_9CNID|nr:Histone H1.0 [Desmophyllum pertusum]